MSSRKKHEMESVFNNFGKPKEDTFDFESIASFFHGKDQTANYQTISDKVFLDLDFKEVFKFVDRTLSRIGQQLLYNKLKAISFNTFNISEYENVISTIKNEAQKRKQIQRLLYKLNDNESFYITSLFQNDHIKPPKWFFITYLLSFAMILSLILLPFTPSLVFLIMGIFVVNLIIHYWNKRNLQQYLYSLPRLLILNRIAKKLFAVAELKPINPNIRKSTKDIDKVKSRMSFFKLESNMDSELMSLLWSIIELIKIAFLAEPIMLFSALKQLNTKRKEIEEVYTFVGRVDVLQSVASLRAGLTNYCIPEITTNDKKIKAVNIYHPLIKDCVENTLYSEEKSVLLTGSNMSGKTSFIRTIGINTICALSINTCFATEFEIPRFRIFSAIRISDDLLNDKSYYFEEVLTIKAMIDKSKENKPNLFLLDEIFKGTNTIERISAGKAVLSALSKNTSLTFVSTHDIELADLLNAEFDLYHFSEIVDHSNVAFDYKLKPGKLKKRNALRILELNDYPKEIIAEAIQLSKKLDNESSYT